MRNDELRVSHPLVLAHESYLVEKSDIRSSPKNIYCKHAFTRMYLYVTPVSTPLGQ